MKLKAGLKVRNIAGESVVLMQAKGVTDMTKVISLNKSSLFLWNKLVGKDFELEDVTNLLLGQYEVEKAQAEADAAKWIETLEGCGAIVK